MLRRDRRLEKDHDDVFVLSLTNLSTLLYRANLPSIELSLFVWVRMQESSDVITHRRILKMLHLSPRKDYDYFYKLLIGVNRYMSGGLQLGPSTDMSMSEEERIAAEAEDYKMVAIPHYQKKLRLPKIFNYYYVIDTSDPTGKSLRAMCKSCETTICYSRRATSNLITHLKRKHPLNYADYAELQSPGTFLTSNHSSFINRTSSSDVRGDQIILQVQDHPHHQMMDLSKPQYQAMEALASQTSQSGEAIYSTYVPTSTETGVPQAVSMHGMTYSADASSTTHLRRTSYGDQSTTTKSSTPQHSITDADGGSNHLGDFYPEKMDSKSWFLLFMADTMLPPSIVANPNFKGFIRSLNPKFSLPSEEVFMSEWIPQRQEHLKRNIQEQLLDVERVCMVVTKLTQSDQQHLINFSVCFIKDWNFRRVLLACRIFVQEPLNDTISHIIDELQTEYQLDGKITQRLMEEDVLPLGFPGFSESSGDTRSDQTEGETEQKPYQEETTNMGGQWLTSFQQDLQSCIADGLKDVQQVCDCIQRVVQSHGGRDAVDGTASSESQDGGITDWLSQLKFLKAVTSSSQLSDQEQQLLNDLFDTLEPFEDAMDYIDKHKDNIPISFAIPCIRGLQRHLSFINQTSCQKLLFQLKAGLIKRMSKFESSRICKLAATLDPRFKVTWCSQQELSNIKEVLLEASIETAERLNFYGIDLTHSEDVDEDAGNTSKLFKLMGSPQQNKPNFQEVKVNEEVNNYLSLPCSKNNTDPLHFWKTHAGELPLLSLLASNILCIPAASPCKTDFDQGMVKNLPKSTLERLVFIRINSMLS